MTTRKDPSMMEQMTTMTALAILSAAFAAALSNEPKPGSVLFDLQAAWRETTTPEVRTP